MNIEDKIFLAKWMLFILSPHKGLNGEYLYRRQLDNAIHSLKDWNPDTNHAHFKEVISNLSETEASIIENMLYDSKEWGSHTGGILGDYLWATNNMKKVMEIILEVLRDEQR